MEKLDRFYEKINGSYFGIIGFIISFVSVLIAQMLYMAVDPSFSGTSNFISDLGIGPNGSDIVFNNGMILSGIFLILFYTYIGWYLQKNGSNYSIKLGILAGIVSSMGQILVGIYPLNSNNKFSYNMHILAAGILFYGLLIMLLIYGYNEYRNYKFPNSLTILSFIYAILFGAFITSVIFQYLSSIPFQIFTYILEWVGLWVGGIWIIAHIYFSLKNK